MMLPAHRRFAAATIVLAASASASVARADDAKIRCAAAYEQAQELRRQDKLSASRTQLAICEQTCPRALASDCTRWQSEVGALMPTVRLRALDGEGHPLDARVFLDGALLLEHLVDAPVLVDSGEHTFRFESPSGVTSDARVSVHGGERSREIAVVLSLAPPSAAPEHARPIPTATFVLGAIGIVGLGLGGALSLKGHLDAAHLQATCAPACDPRDVNAIGTLYDVGWLSAGVGVASLAAALLLWRPWEHASSAAAHRLYVAPALGGATIGVTLM
jgi:hypothetical protein